MSRIFNSFTLKQKMYMKQKAYLWLSGLMLILAFEARAWTPGTAADDPAKSNKEMPSVQTTKFEMISPGTEPSPMFRFPEDTLQQFLKNYGKDSLLHLLDQRINLTRLYLNTYSIVLNDEHAISVLKLVSKQYKLGLDTIKYPNYKADAYFLKLYGRTLGNVYKFLDTAKIKTMSADQFHEMYVPAFKDTNILTRIALPLAILAPYVDVSKKTVDALIKHYSTIYYPEAQYYLYYALREYGSYSPAKKALTDPYAKVLADSLYANNNFPKAMDKHLAENKSAGYYQDYLKPVRFLAYGLYAGDVNLDQHGADLMYLLSAQKPDGGWYSVVGSSRDIHPTVYSLWALCEFRQRVQALK